MAFSQLHSYGLAGTEIQLHDSEFVRCYNGFADGSQQPWLRNVLAWNLRALVAASTDPGDILHAEHLTAHNCVHLMEDPTGGMMLTNCLFVAVTNLQASYWETNGCVVLASDTGVFQTVGGGSHYLAPNSPYRNAGATNLSAATLASIRSRTTYPPLVYSNITISAETTFHPQAQRDTDQPDIGWHAPALDVVFAGVTATTNLTFQAGTVAGWFRTSSGYYHAGHGINLADRVQLAFLGTAERPACWARANLLQEGGNGLWVAGGGGAGITGWAWPNFSDAPKVSARFTRFPMASFGAMAMRDDNGYLDVEATHCHFSGGSVGGYLSRLALTNCLLNSMGLWMDTLASIPDNTNCSLHLHSSLYRQGNFYLSRYAGGDCGWCGESTCYSPDCGSSCCFYPCWCEYCGHGCCDCVPGGCDCDYCWQNHTGSCTCGSPPPAVFPLWSIRDTAFEGATWEGTDEAQADPQFTLYSHDAFDSYAANLNLPGTNHVIATNGFNWQTGWFGRYYLPTNSPLINAGSVTNAGYVGLYHFTTQTNQTKDAATRLDIGLHSVAAGTGGLPLDSDGDGIPDYLEDIDGQGDADAGETDWQVYNSLNGLSAGKGLRVFTPLK